MADQNYSPGDWRFGNLLCNNLTVSGSILPGLPRTSINQTVLAEYPVDLASFRIWDAIQTPLTGTAGTDDLALIGTTYGTAPPSIRTSDAKATSITQRARVFVPIPAEYDAGETIQFRISAGMITTVSDNGGATTIDVEAWEVDSDNTLGSADLVATSATTINSLTFSDKDFTLTATDLVPGDILDVRVTIAITDAATATAVIGAFCKFKLLCDIRG